MTVEDENHLTRKLVLLLRVLFGTISRAPELCNITSVLSSIGDMATTLQCTDVLMMLIRVLGGP